MAMVPNTAGIDNFCPLPSKNFTPVNVDILSQYLTGYPDPDIRNYLIHGFTNGFDIMYTGPVTSTRPKNLKSAMVNAENVTKAIDIEIGRRHTSGPFVDPPFFLTHCSPLGAVQKDNNKPDVRLILALSQLLSHRALQ